MMRRLIPIAAVVSTAAALASIAGGVAAQVSPPALPSGPGHDEVAAKCGTCHPLTMITDRRQTEAEWSETLDKMIGLGAKVTEDDKAVVLQYLIANFGLGEAPAAPPSTGK